MTDEELNRKFKDSDLPHITLPSAKARLRRELLTSPHFEERAGRIRSFARVRYALTALAAIAIATLVVIQFIPERLSAKGLIRTMEAAYSSHVVEGAVHYLRQSLALPRDRRFEVETWIHPEENKIRIRLKDATADLVMAHSIIESGRVYGLPTATDRKSGSIKGVPHGSQKPSHGGTAMTVVIMRLDADDEFSDETMVRILAMDDGFSGDQFAKKTPRAVVADLSQSPDVTYAGATFDSESGQRLEALERRNAAAMPFTLEFPMKHLKKVEWFLSSVVSKEISFEMDVRFSEFLEQNDLEGEVKIKPIESVETIEVFAETSRIHRVTLAIFEQGVETYRAEKTFLEDRYLSYEPDMFSPEHHGLTQSPNTNERKTK